MPTRVAKKIARPVKRVSWTRRLLRFVFGLLALLYLFWALSLFALSLFGAASATSVLACASAGYFFVASLSLLVYLYTSEIYPTRIRAFGCGVASAWLRLASTIGPGIVGFMIVSHGLRSLFAVFGAFALFGGLATVLAGIETRSRLLEELSP